MKNEEILQQANTLLMGHADHDFVSRADALAAATDLHNLMIGGSHQQSIINLIFAEVDRAQNKHPNWPEDMVYAAAIVAEENGELTRAAVQYQMEGGTLEAIKMEAIQTAATCIRLLLSLADKA
jgi:NTP pyrophosphatase (non-canonical NTP hydrolase)